MSRTLIGSSLPLCSLVMVAACDSGPKNEVLLLQDGNSLRQLSTTNRVIESQGRRAVDDAFARNEDPAAIRARLAGRDLRTLSPSERADLAILAARDICNVPDNQRLEPNTRCIP